MSGAVVIFDGVWKKFRRGERHDSLRSLIPGLFSGLRRRTKEELEAQEFWALRDVSFDVNRGEAFGIIGPNGAGKSTTLKLLTKILRPTQGRCSVHGRVGALIEVASGFHPDLTGRENIFLQGAIMGMKRFEIAGRIDDIIEFAGVGDFIDTPVKKYSSGMNARLGFSIAAHLNPDVLIIDEVLSVGDMAFQERCLDRMKEFRESGATLVFVSHNLQAVATLCNRAICLQGTTKSVGPTADVLEYYLSTQSATKHVEQSGDVQIGQTQLLGIDASKRKTIQPGTPLTLKVSYHWSADVSDLTFGFLMYRSTDHLLVYDGNVRSSEIGISGSYAGKTLVVEFDFKPHVTRGQYHIDLHVFHNPTQRFLARKGPVATFSVHETRAYAGIADLDLTARVSLG